MGHVQTYWYEHTEASRVVLPAAGPGANTLTIERQCVFCRATKPREGFAPAFTDVPLNEPVPADESGLIFVLCWYCYRWIDLDLLDYLNSFEDIKALRDKLRVRKGVRKCRRLLKVWLKVGR